MNKFSIIFLILIVFGSLILGPLFIKNGTQGNLPIIFPALAQESSDSESDDSGDEKEEEETDDEKEEVTEEETDDEKEEVTEEETDAENETCDETEETEETEETGDEEEEETEEETDDEKEDEETEEITDALTDSEEHTVLDEIINDKSLLDNVIKDETTDPGLVSTLLVIKQEQELNPPTETCDNQADDDGDGTIDEEDCTPTTSPPIETCDNQADDDGDGKIDEEGCVPPIAEICDNGVDDNADGKIDTADENCPIVKPTVVIESAVDELGNSLSPGDMTLSNEVTFIFSAQGSEATEIPEDENSQGNQFECSLDDGPFSTCSSPETVTMEKGKHTFIVRLVS